MLSTRIRHSFIPAPVEEVSELWTEFQAKVAAEDPLPQRLRGRALKESDSSRVHFIPAAGGCFLVVVDLPRARTWMGQLLQANQHANESSLIERFRAHIAELGDAAARQHAPPEPPKPATLPATPGA